VKQPLIWLAFLAVAGLGAYRAFRFGRGRRRFWGVLPVGLLLVGGLVFPFLFGLLRGAGVVPRVAGIGGEELLIVAVVGPVLLAVISGAILSLVFRPVGAPKKVS
jgi:hypothetical protein